jgi:DNA-binding phage protein
VSTRKDYLREVVQALLADLQAAAGMGKLAREAALARYGLARFLADWDRLLGQVVR